MKTDQILKFRHYFPSTKVITAGHHPLTIIQTSTGKEDFWKDAVWMQFMNKFDSEGNEIYEGDIYEYQYDYDSDYDGDIPIVKTAEGRIQVNDIFDCYWIDRAKEEGGTSKVIGNIYKNPDLVKSK